MRVRFKRTFATPHGRYPARPEGVDVPDDLVLPSDALVWDGKKFVAQPNVDLKKAAKAAQKSEFEPEPDVVSAEMYRDEKLLERTEGRHEQQQNEDRLGPSAESTGEDRQAADYKRDVGKTRAIERGAEAKAMETAVDSRARAIAGEGVLKKEELPEGKSPDGPKPPSAKR